MSVIEVRQFSKSFGENSVHKNVSFSVDKGECLGLVGGSGVGKSVILRSLIGLEKPDSGQILIDQIDITEFSELDLIPVRKKVAYVFQNGALFDSMSVYENLAYPLREHTQLRENEIRQRVHELLVEFGLESAEDLTPAELSGGMQKRVGLARAIIIQPEVVLYDEPTAGLDPFNTNKIREMVLRLKSKGVTSILVTHDMPTALAVCDRMALLLGGVVKTIGTIDELHRDPDNPIQKFMNGEEV